ncbi:alpha/beta hydrolase [Flavobacterium sp. P4023]|uniref:Alpha/beta hydrolase n=1 Tax=Flavobacterium flabelliforme TaxID=2816119 RepID=A0ABS5CU39_9FLAO|nr:YqiA/YcfP family alpha/beta fold hydrolase [Flavobacterium flabelliforme]MBP4142122.1 alpha/beta hydrolase [Flavobacterium flabelliforme]
MTLLYLHGLESKLSPEKRDVLERFATVIAPDMDYNSDPNIFKLLLKNNNEHSFDLIMGSSMGGFMAYYIANTIKCPALLFNPALPHRPIAQNIPEIDSKNTPAFLQFVLGGQDEVIKANSTLKWLAENRLPTIDIKISIHNKLGHQIPVSIFEKEVIEFFKQIELLKLN